MLLSDNSSKIIHKINKIDAKLKIVQRTISSPDCSLFVDEMFCLLGEALEQLGECEDLCAVSQTA
ncbi:hypothetical protein E6W93_22365 [Salmonella enterica subsp. enterica serovar Uppsala]|nr:hypothetical protein [Salmonella enterica subsp. enterica serovar Uppsala]